MFTLLAASEEVRGLYPEGLAGNPRRDSGVDLVFPEACEVPGGATVALDLGVRAVHLSPEPRAFWLLARSSLAKTPLMLANGVGLVDLGYRGPIKAMVWNRDRVPFRVEKGQASSSSLANLRTFPRANLRCFPRRTRERPSISRRASPCAAAGGSEARGQAARRPRRPTCMRGLTYPSGAAPPGSSRATGRMSGF